MEELIPFFITFAILGITVVVVLTFVLNYEDNFLKNNYRELKINDFIVYDYEVFENAYYSICKLYNFHVGKFKVVDFDDKYCVIKIKDKYFLIDGENMKYLYSQQSIIEDKLCDTYLKYHSKEDEVND